MCHVNSKVLGLQQLSYNLLRAHNLITKKITRKVLILRNIIFKRNFRNYTLFHHQRLQICNNKVSTTC